MTGCSGGTEKKSESPAETPKASVQITQFYANPPAVARGEKALLCYGVEGAASVRIDPPVEQLSPALTRCFEVTPTETTEYKLTAEGRGGDTTSQSVTVQVGGARPKLFDLSINKTAVGAGEQVNFCFQSRNATTVRGKPGKFLRGGNAAKDCLTDKPEKTTTYEIVVANAQGMTDSASMTVEVR